MRTQHAVTTVLLVEEDFALGAIHGDALTDAGYAVVTAHDGLDALRVLDEERPAGIVLDLELPPLSGCDLRVEIVAHAETRRIPVVALTRDRCPDPALDACEFEGTLQAPVVGRASEYRRG